MNDSLHNSAYEIAALIAAKELKAVEMLEWVLQSIETHNPKINAFTEIFSDEAYAQARTVDAQIAAGKILGPLAGVPFAVKNLFDLKDKITLAGSVIEKDSAPATEDATMVAHLKAAGAICVGTLNMDEYAYGFTTENTHYGPTRNPHNLDHVAGGSSGGSAAAVAAGCVPFTLGSDTNGSIRVPSSFCGLFGFQATYGRISRHGAFLFVASIDRVGPFARSAKDLALIYDATQGYDPKDPVSNNLPIAPVMPTLENDIDDLKIAQLGGHFKTMGLPEVIEAATQVADFLKVKDTVEIPYAAQARAAAYTITASEGGSHHLKNLKTRPHDFDPMTRDRLFHGNLIPQAWYHHAQKFRSYYYQEVMKLFKNWDIFIAPTTPTPAPKVGQEKMTINGNEMLARPNHGMFTQPLSLIGLPIASVPIQRPGQLPIGVMIIGAPHAEEKVLRVARFLENAGIAQSGVAELE